ncbi:MAG TPA: sigma factor-like helix-turn-helix DNA-binding protein [Streptosporangiaceae bacterium]|nr:sigma factor-like helix-turn-helix DNA-binding protein [Streptosporangiaceae bacterium]
MSRPRHGHRPAARAGAAPARKRACVVLRYYLDLSEADTAAVLGVSVGTVKRETAKALVRRQALLAEPGTTSVPRPGHDRGGC